MNDRVRKCCLHVSQKLRDAMQTLENGVAGVALVIDDEQRLVGLITDGDIRRALLRGGDLALPILPYVNRGFTAVGPEESRAYVLDLMQSRRISQIPIVDASGRLTGLHLLREILGGIPRPNLAVVMAGGLGTRLRPITEHLPKPMLRVAGRPILERLVLHLVGFGMREVYLAIRHLGHVVEQHFGDGSRFGCRIHYLREEKELGTGGALALLPVPPRDPVLVLNGDLVTQFNLQQLLEFHQQGGYVATMAVRPYIHTVPFGCIEVENGRMVRLVEKPLLQQTINAGVYVLAPELVRRVPQEFFPITNLFEDCLQRGEPVGAWEIEEDWIDVGQREQLRQAQEGSR